MNSKLKGNRFEREAAAILRAIWPECYTSRFMGSAWDDYNGIDLTGTPGFNVQCKHVERLSPGYHEILSAMPQGKTKNIILHKRNNRGIIVAMTLEDFLSMVRK